jgi:hypothetical protein
VSYITIVTNGNIIVMNQTDLNVFNQAVELAQDGQTATAYRQLLSIAPRNHNDPNLLSSLIFIAPTYQDKMNWVEQARSVASSDAAVQAALNWFAQQPKPTPIVVAPPPPDLYQSSASPNYQPTMQNFVTQQPEMQMQIQQPYHQQQFSYAPVPLGQPEPKQASVETSATSPNSNQSPLSKKTKAKNFSKGVWLSLVLAVAVAVLIIAVIISIYMLR